MKSFELQIKEFENMTAEKSEKIFRKVCFDLSNSIIMDVPVLSGRAKGSFFPEINKVSNEVNAVDDTDKSGNKSNIRVANTTNRLQLGSYFTFTSNLDYILGLEYGKSQKSPAGFVGINVMRFQNFVNQANKDIK